MSRLNRPSAKRLERRSALLKAVGHPVRLRVLTRFVLDGDRSAAEVAKSLDVSLSAISYHVRILADHGLLLADGDRSVRGAIEHLYQPAPIARKLLNAIDGL